MSLDPSTPEASTPEASTTGAGNPAGHPPAPRHSRTRKWVAAAAVAGALLGTTGIAMAQTSNSSGTDSTTAPTEQVDRTQAVHPGEELLTGDTATKVADAARAAVPDATVDRVETDAEGSPYEAHMTKSDGTHVTVKVDDGFSVTGVETDPGGPGGPGGMRGPAPAPAPATSQSTTA